MAYAFTPDRIAHLRKHSQEIHALLLPSSARPKAGTIRRYQKEWARRDEDGKIIDVVRELAGILTIIRVERVELYESGPSLQLARECGFRTSSALKAAWLATHPRSPLAQAVWFALGDWRDQDRFLQRQIWRGGDYTTNRGAAIDDLPVLSAEQLADIAAVNRQRDIRRDADTQQRLAAETLAERARRLERGGEEVAHLTRRELAVIGQRLGAAERRTRKLAE